jgi:hypothetical protein
MKTAAVVAFVLLSLILILATDQYLFCPVYRFSPPQAFKGDSLYNPYQNVKAGEWIRCNFHAHTHCWDGLTNGNGSDADIDSIYNRLHYGIHEVSNYEFIDTALPSDKQHINCYEHGYNIRKTHQLVIGASGVCLVDYLFPQTINNKQEILNLLDADTGALVALSHPRIRKAYEADDFSSLTGYSCMEVENPAGSSPALWDAALTAGNPVFILGDDDVHDVFDSTRVGRMSTMVNAPDTNKKNIIGALKAGSDYALVLDNQMTVKERKEQPVLLPALEKCTVTGNSLSIYFNEPAKEIDISGKYGKILNRQFNRASASYSIPRTEPYVREVATFKDGSQILLNPVFRFSKKPFKQAGISVNKQATFSLRSLGLLLLLTWFGYAGGFLIKQLNKTGSNK